MKKPYKKDDSWQKAGFKEKVLVIKRYEDFKKAEKKLFVASKKLVIQEWIPGKDSNVYFCLTYFNKNGEKIDSYTGKKLLQWPPIGHASVGPCSATIPMLKNFCIRSSNSRCFSTSAKSARHSTILVLTTSAAAS